MSVVATGPGSLALGQVSSRLLGRMTLLTAPAWLYGAIDQGPALARWWNLGVVGLIAAATVPILVAGARRLPDRWPAVALAVAVAVAVVLWPVGVVDSAATADRLPWLWLIMPLALAAVATLNSFVASGCYVLAVGGIYTVYRFDEVAGTGEFPYPLVEWGLLTTVGIGLALLVRAARSGAQRLDEDARQAALARTEAAGLAATAATRAEVDAVLHDKVLAALLLAVRSPGSPEIAPLARDALAALAGSGAEGVQADLVDITDLRRRIEAGVRLLSPGVAIVAGDGPAVPEPVARAIVEASAEAVRNSVRHAVPGRVAEVRVVVGSAAGRPVALAVEITDDGPGFDPETVSPDRLGLAVSVAGRVRSAGGRAVVRSVPGVGTTVSLVWPAPADGGPS